MNTLVIIPYRENKDKNILSLLSMFSDKDILKFNQIPEKIQSFRDGNDLDFEVPTKVLPDLLRSLNDDGYIYTPHHLKALASKYLSQRVVYSQIHIDGKIIEITGSLKQTYNDMHAVVILEDAPFLTDAKKEKLIAAIKRKLTLVATDVRSCDIDILTIRYSSLGVTEEDLLNAVKEWTLNAFKLK